MGHFLRSIPRSKILVADTKPRFRAEWELTGISAKRRYRKWDHGDVMPGSVRLDLDQDDGGQEKAWQLGHRIAIAQTDRERDIPKLNRIIAKFFAEARAREPRLVYVDELLDFFGVNGQPKAGSGEDRDAIKRCATAGRELGISLLCSTQRPAGVPRAVVQELSKLYLFRLDSEEDVISLYRWIGLPRRYTAPRNDREFLLYDRQKRSGQTLTLSVR